MGRVEGSEGLASVKSGLEDPPRLRCNTRSEECKLAGSLGVREADGPEGGSARGGDGPELGLSRGLRKRVLRLGLEPAAPRGRTVKRHAFLDCRSSGQGLVAAKME